MKNKDINTGSLIGPIAKGFKKYNLTIFIVVLVTGLAIAVLMLNATLQQSSDTTGYTAATKPTNFDQVTITRVNQLHTSTGAPSSITLPSTRINPFAE